MHYIEFCNILMFSNVGDFKQKSFILDFKKYYLHLFLYVYECYFLNVLQFLWLMYFYMKFNVLK